uniref:Stomatin-like protein 2 n=1 Tax=Aceria tosichella TaxID=561515 RepID=A0A6G1S7H6_9ACAR
MFAQPARRMAHRALLSAAAHRCQPTSMAGAATRFNCLHDPLSIGHSGELNLSPLTSGINYQSNRHRHSLPYNTVVVFVPHQEAWVVERMGKFHKILEPGVNVLFPVIDRVRYVQSLKEMAFEIVPQSAITADNVTLTIDGVLYLKVFDPYKASYNIENPEFSVTQLAITTMRSEIGKIQLDSVFRERESLNTIIVGAINDATSSWGISCLRYEIRDIKVPTRVQDAMQLQVEAERKRRARILESEGTRDAEINVANGEATAIMARAKAKANALTSVSNAIKADAASFLIAEQYVKAFSNLARTNNTLILPADAGDINRMVAQAFQVYKTMSSPPAMSNPDIKLENVDGVEGSDGYLSDLEDAIRDKNSPLSPTSSTTNNKTNKTGSGSKQKQR